MDLTVQPDGDSDMGKAAEKRDLSTVEVRSLQEFGSRNRVDICELYHTLARNRPMFGTAGELSWTTFGSWSKRTHK